MQLRFINGNRAMRVICNKDTASKQATLFYSDARYSPYVAPRINSDVIS